MSSSSSLFHQSPSATISGTEINSSGGDHNRLVVNCNIYVDQGTQINPNNESALTGGQNPLASSGDVGQGPSVSPVNLGAQPHCSVTPKANALIEDEESPNARYERHLLLKKHGFPLWAPQPHSRLPLSYRRKGVSIGDVGIITRQGYFDFLFNICLPRGHASNPGFLPINFSPVELSPTDVSEVREHDLGSCLLTSSIERLRGFTFKCNGPEGSILAMPNGAYHEDLLNLQKFKKIVSQNAENWYRFALGSCGREIGNGQLLLVTGCDKTNLWGIATYSDSRAGTLTLTANGVQSPIEYTWDYEGRVEAKAGPRLDELLDAAGSQGSAGDIRNQCTFLRSFTVTLADDVWRTMVSTLVQNSSDNHILNSRESRSYFASIVSGSFFGFGSGGGSVNVRNHSLWSEKSTVHPATIINQMLLSQYPNAKVAISHDNNWCAVIREDEITMPDAPELLGRIQQTFTSHFDEDGTVYLSQEHAPEGNPQRQSLSLNDFSAFLGDPERAQGTLFNATGNTNNEGEKLSVRARGKKRKGPQPTSQETRGLPNEILLHAFSFLPLKSLIIGGAVSHGWRLLIPHADISPVRRALFEFYLTLVRSPIFPQTRPWVLANLQSFDRQAYINDLMDRHCYVPEAFRVWILEWPARAVVGCVWPGLPNVYSLKGRRNDDVHRIEGTNWLTPVSPTVYTIPFQNCTSKAEVVPALPTFRDRQGTVWLMLDERDTLRDKVYTFAERGGDAWDEKRSTEWDVIDADWIGWQLRTWSNIEATWFRRRQLQAHSWQQMDDLEVREALYFDEPE